MHQEALQLIYIRGLLPEALLHNQVHPFQAILFQFLPGIGNHLIRHGLANQDHLDLFVVARVGHRTAQDLRIREAQLLGHEVTHPIVEVAGANQVITQEKAGHDREENNQANIALHLLLALLVQEHLLGVFQQTNYQIGSQADKDRIDKEEVEGPKEIVQITTRQAKTSRTEGRHQGRSDRYTRDHVAFVLRRAGHDTGHTTKEGDQHIIDRWLRTGQQLTLRLAQGREQEIKRGGNHAEERRRRQVAERALDQFKIGDTQSQAKAHDRPHQR